MYSYVCSELPGFTKECGVDRAKPDMGRQSPSSSADGQPPELVTFLGRVRSLSNSAIRCLEHIHVDNPAIQAYALRQIHVVYAKLLKVPLKGI